MKYKPTTNSRMFTSISIDVDKLDEIISRDGFPFYVGSCGVTNPLIPWIVQAYHVELYYNRLSEIVVDRIVARPVIRLSNDDEIASGRGVITVIDGLETIAALKDATMSMIEVEVLWRQAAEIEARLI